MILDFDSRFSGDDQRAMAARHPSSQFDRTPPTGRTATGPAVVARVSGSAWIADCPTLGCGGAEYVSFDRPVFFCCECRNREAGHAYLPVVVPAPKLRAEIAAVLEARPEPSTRHWYPRETVAQLRAENRAHGVPETVGR